jgi:CheY-like chemotaxis protein
MTSLLLVDDNPEFCESSMALLRQDGFEVVGCVDTGAAAVEAVRFLHPDVVLLDVQLPDLDGFEVARRLATLDPPPAVILISSRDASTYGRLIDDAPVRGFIDKVALDGVTIAAFV